jgi:hypothetical protein
VTSGKLRARRAQRGAALQHLRNGTGSRTEVRVRTGMSQAVVTRVCTLLDDEAVARWGRRNSPVADRPFLLAIRPGARQGSPCACLVGTCRCLPLTYPELSWPDGGCAGRVRCSTPTWEGLARCRWAGSCRPRSARRSLSTTTKNLMATGEGWSAPRRRRPNAILRYRPTRHPRNPEPVLDCPKDIRGTT